MDLKIALINPNLNVKEEYGPLGGFVIPHIPMGLGFIAGYIRSQGYNNVKIFDEQISSMNSKSTFQKFINFAPDIVGFGAINITFV